MMSYADGTVVCPECNIAGISASAVTIAGGENRGNVCLTIGIDLPKENVPDLSSSGLPPDSWIVQVVYRCDNGHHFGLFQHGKGDGIVRLSTTSPVQ